MSLATQICSIEYRFALALPPPTVLGPGCGALARGGHLAAAIAAGGSVAIEVTFSESDQAWRDTWARITAAPSRGNPSATVGHRYTALCLSAANPKALLAPDRPTGLRAARAPLVRALPWTHQVLHEPQPRFAVHDTIDGRPALHGRLDPCQLEVRHVRELLAQAVARDTRCLRVMPAARMTT